jgi:type I restriction enzyme M protein
MNLAIRGIDANLGPEHGDSFHRDLHPDLKADYILANPPFNSSDWGGERLRQDKRWKFNAPPVGNANFAWVQHFIYHLSPTGLAGFVLANGSMSSNQSGEAEIRRNIIEADLVDCMVALSDFSYVVVLTDRREYVLPWTAYLVEEEHQREKLVKEYEAFKATQKS